MKDVCKTLFEPVACGSVVFDDKKILFLNAVAGENLASLDVIIQQHFKPYADGFRAAGGNKFYALPDNLPADEKYDVVMLLFPKAMAEGRYLLAVALGRLKPGGLVMCAADNKAGGGRLKTVLTEFGVTDLQDISKNKARVVWGHYHVHHASIDGALKAGALQPILNGEFKSQPGIFGWDKIDAGSKLLLSCLPEFKGVGADFGCGYGYLSRAVLEKSPAIRTLHCADADMRAVEACRQNLEGQHMRAAFHWLDLSKPEGLPFDGLDFIVMNPPFHEGKAVDSDIGAAFIVSASKVLRRGGHLWLVANRHLPYEQALQTAFAHVEPAGQGNGFKVYHAVKK